MSFNNIFFNIISEVVQSEKLQKLKGLVEYKRICSEKLLTKENFIRKYR